MTYSNETLFNTHKAKIYHEILRDKFSRNIAYLCKRKRETLQR